MSAVDGINAGTRLGTAILDTRFRRERAAVEDEQFAQTQGLNSQRVRLAERAQSLDETKYRRVAEIDDGQRLAAAFKMRLTNPDGSPKAITATEMAAMANQLKAAQPGFASQLSHDVFGEDVTQSATSDTPFAAIPTEDGHVVMAGVNKQSGKPEILTHDRKAGSGDVVRTPQGEFDSNVRSMIDAMLDPALQSRYIEHGLQKDRTKQVADQNIRVHSANNRDDEQSENRRFANANDRYLATRRAAALPIEAPAQDAAQVPVTTLGVNRPLTQPASPQISETPSGSSNAASERYDPNAPFSARQFGLATREQIAQDARMAKGITKQLYEASPIPAVLGAYKAAGQGTYDFVDSLVNGPRSAPAAPAPVPSTPAQPIAVAPTQPVQPALGTTATHPQATRTSAGFDPDKLAALAYATGQPLTGAQTFDLAMYGDPTATAKLGQRSAARTATQSAKDTWQGDLESAIDSLKPDNVKSFGYNANDRLTLRAGIGAAVEATGFRYSLEQMEPAQRQNAINNIASRVVSLPEEVRRSPAAPYIAIAGLNPSVVDLEEFAENAKRLAPADMIASTLLAGAVQGSYEDGAALQRDAIRVAAVSDLAALSPPQRAEVLKAVSATPRNLPLDKRVAMAKQLAGL